MGLGYKIPFFVLVTSIVIGLGGYFIFRDGEVPVFPDQYWGSSSSSSAKQDTSIRPFQINISEKVLTHLKTQLSLEVSTLDDRIVDSLEGVAFEYGMNKIFLKKVTNYWLNKYDWRAREKLLNKYPSFITKISGIDIHFQHVKPSKKAKGGTKPLLLLHGWPSSFVEYQKMIPIFLDPKDSDINFEVIVASLPGYAFSEGAKRPGLDLAEMAIIFSKLMKRLGHEQFYVQGGDWGSLIASNMATMYKENVLGIHMTLCMSTNPRSLVKFGMSLLLPQLLMDEDEVVKYTPVTEFLSSLAPELGYFILQATKPDTIGAALSNPISLSAYVLEKFSFHTNKNWIHKNDGGISEAYNLDELLDNLMVHYFGIGGSITSSMRIYKETVYNLLNHQLALDRVPVQVPVNCLSLPNELFGQPKFALLEKFPNLRYSKAKTGGHFNALEIPNIVAADIVDAFTFMNSEAKKPKT